MRSITAFVFLACLCVIAGCAAQPLPQEATFKTLTAPYQLDSGDKLRVTVFEQANLSASYTVDQAGFVTLPLIGQVPARGRSTQELSKDIATKLKDGFIKDPDVSIEIQTHRPFFILGEIKTGGQYEYVNGLTAQSAVAIAGGFAPQADRQTVQITRQLNGKITHGKADINTPIRPGDTIMVNRRRF